MRSAAERLLSLTKLSFPRPKRAHFSWISSGSCTDAEISTETHSHSIVSYLHWKATVGFKKRKEKKTGKTLEKDKRTRLPLHISTHNFLLITSLGTSGHVAFALADIRKCNAQRPNPVKTTKSGFLSACLTWASWWGVRTEGKLMRWLVVFFLPGRADWKRQSPVGGARAMTCYLENEKSSCSFSVLLDVQSS